MKHWNLKRVLSLLLVVCMVTGLLSGVSAMAEDQTANYHEISTDGLKLATEDNAAADETETEEAPYADTDVVRVFVVLEDKPVLQQGYATRSIAGNAAAMAVSKALEAKQAALAAEISANVLSGETLNVHWNLTLAANAMSVDLPYGKMDEVEALKGVKSVMLVPQYSIDPREQADLNTISSGIYDRQLQRLARGLYRCGQPHRHCRYRPGFRPSVVQQRCVRLQPAGYLDEERQADRGL